MATQSVRFKFCFPANPSNQEIHFDHIVPRAIIQEAPSDPVEVLRVGQLFASTIKDVSDEHESVFLARCGTKCITCGKTSSACIPTPVGHDIENSWIRIAVNPVCFDWKCLYEAKKDVINAFPEGVSLPGGGSSQTLTCKVCGTTTDVKRCTRCKDVAYCGKEHQKMDWKTHKKTCVEKHDCDVCQVEATRDSTQMTPGGETSEEDEWVSTDDDSDKDDYESDFARMSITYTGVFNLAAPGQPPRYVELTKDQVLAHLLSGRDPE